MIVVGVALILAAPALLKFAGTVDTIDAFFERAKELGFTLDPTGAATIRSQLPRLGAPQRMNRHRRRSAALWAREPRWFERTEMRRGNQEVGDPENEVEITVLRRDTFETTTLVFLAQKWMLDADGQMEGRMLHDRLLVAINPKNSAFVPAVDAAVLADSGGWHAEAHGGWLLLYRLQPHTEWATTLDVTLQDASDLAARLLAPR